MAAFDLQSLAETLGGVVEKIFKAASPPVQFSDKPAVEERDIIEYEGRMRVSGMEIFNGPTYISAVSFYRSPKDQEDHKACGGIVVYLEEKHAEIFLRALGQKNIDEDDPQAVVNACGEVGKTISERFKEELAAAGYASLGTAAAQNYHNYVPSGVEFSFDQYKKCEISFKVKGQKALAVDLTMAPIPQGK